MAVTNVELLKLGLRIRAFRKVLGRNQKDFSKQCGLDRSYFGGVERGERNLSFFILCQICAGLNCDIAAVTKGIPHPEPFRSSGNARHFTALNSKIDRLTRSQVLSVQEAGSRASPHLVVGRFPEFQAKRGGK